jgi:hypothetical protein
VSLDDASLDIDTFDIDTLDIDTLDPAPPGAELAKSRELEAPPLSVAVHPPKPIARAIIKVLTLSKRAFSRVKLSARAR